MSLVDLFEEQLNTPKCPRNEDISQLIGEFLGLIFPVLSDHRHITMASFEKNMQSVKMKFEQLVFSNRINCKKELEIFFNELLPLKRTLNLDAQALLNGDPAANDIREIQLTYPGFYAIAVYRIAHELYKIGIELFPRMLTEIAHSKTGIDIHPGAKIGTSFFIDHGTGVVIGETTIIGNHVKIYQGVTLGAHSVKKELAKTKRHPTIEDEVVIYSGATILGGNTKIGRRSIIGGNVWLVESVPENSIVLHNASSSIEIRKNENIN